ncbi:MAG: hypothetical protein EPN97_02670 [Alphaproteobacteria bacterium]|nr:MAG: hypothetical protein EPN97_02670 [Alphaproteobacteria bacterium]
MADKDFFKDNFVLIVGLALPVVLMVGFMLAQSMPAAMTDPPQYDLIFSAQDYQSKNLPVNVLLVVKDGTLKAQYTKVANPQYPSTMWYKLYRYDAKTQQVSELPFGYPEDMDKIETTREDTVEATKNLKLSTNLTSPDGYEMSYETNRHHGLVNEILWDFGNHSSEMRLRKGAASVRLTTGNNQYPFYYGSANFVGWVTK